MSSEAGHIQITEFNKEVIPMINWMMEDLFCQYGVSLPWFMCNFKFPDFSQRPDWVSGYNFNLDWGPWGYWLVKFNELLGLLWDEAHLPRWQMPDLSPGSWAFFNDYTEVLHDNMQRHYIYGQSGTFTKDEVVEGETSGVTGYYKWKDGDGYLHICRKRDASGETVREFSEEEKIVGQTSGAYAWTYEDYPQWKNYYPVSNSGRIYNWHRTPVGNYVTALYYYIYGPWPSYYTDKDALLAWRSHSYLPEPYCNSFEVTADNNYLKYNTSDLSGVSEAKIVIPQCGVSSCLGEFPTIYVYQCDYVEPVSYDTFIANWKGGTKIAEKTLTADDSGKDLEIAISPDYVNTDGYSKYKLTFKRIEEDDFWPEPPCGSSYSYVVSSSYNTRLVIKE